jgi:signal peptidase I
MNYQTSYSQPEKARTASTRLPLSQPKRDEPTRYIDATLRKLLETVLFILLVFLSLCGMVQTFRIDGPSMEPNLHSHQYILVNKMIFFRFDINAPLRLLPGRQDVPPHLVYPFRLPHRGDVVVLEPPAGEDDPQAVNYIKRVVGLPGEVLQIKDGLVYINGEPLHESTADGGYLTEETDCNRARLCEPYVIPPGHVIVLGDNRDNSTDSRAWDAEPALPVERIVGQAWFSYWPRAYWGGIPSPTYAH